MPQLGLLQYLTSLGKTYLSWKEYFYFSSKYRWKSWYCNGQL